MHWQKAAFGALGLASAFVCAQPASASDPSAFLTEIITPAGWEVHSANTRCSWDGDAAASGELVVPDGWQRTRGDEPRWSGSCMCSELVIPDAWTRTAQHSRR